MTQRSTELLAEILALPKADRAELTDRLLDSFDGEDDPDGDAPDLHPEWDDEIARRLADYRAGKVTPIPWEEVRRKMFAELNDDAG
jgi:putative addiction module component (TIGR02574 family)